MDVFHSVENCCGGRGKMVRKKTVRGVIPESSSMDLNDLYLVNLFLSGICDCSRFSCYIIIVLL